MIYIADTLISLLRDTGPKPKSKAKNSRVVGIKTRKNFRRLNFLVKSSEVYSSKKGHICSVLFPDVDFKKFIETPEVFKKKITPMNQEVRVGCSCPAFQFWGSAYWSNDFGYNLSNNTEDRFPEIRDPKGENLLCKHLIRVIGYMRKKGFEQLSKRFKTGDLKTASLEDLYPAIGDYLRLHNYDNEEVDDILFSLTEDNFEDELDRIGILVT